MEIDQLKSPATEDDQMEIMMMMMMQMDKFPEFYGAYNNNNNVAEFPPSETNNISSLQHFIDTNNPHSIDSPSFPNMPSNMSFNGTITNPVQETSSMPPYYNNYTVTSSQKWNSVAAMRETIFRIAAMQPIHIDPESVRPPKRRNVKISKDPQSVAARHRRERISERIRILQRLVPGGTKMDTASMLDEAIHYVKFLKTQVQSLEGAAANRPTTGIGFPATLTTGNYLPIGKANYQPVQNGPHY